MNGTQRVAILFCKSRPLSPLDVRHSGGHRGRRTGGDSKSDNAATTKFQPRTKREFDQALTSREGGTSQV